MAKKIYSHLHFFLGGFVQNHIITLWSLKSIEQIESEIFSELVLWVNSLNYESVFVCRYNHRQHLDIWRKKTENNNQIDSAKCEEYQWKLMQIGHGKARQAKKIYTHTLTVRMMPFHLMQLNLINGYWSEGIGGSET